ncbi:MAG: BlaI/MecI/CopY family transcriptional regulator [Candidatus Solibacter usitatus]|nr:BlaI/MecI/CopY family transcriptional regulator [Candidatus Solibacter usitatus]
MRKPAPPREVPPPLELLCLRALWSIEEGKVNAVRQVVSRTKPLAYTTVMTLLDRLARKGTVSRRKVGRAYVYAPARSREAMRWAALREFVDAYFDGSYEALAEFLRQPKPETNGAAAADDPGLDAVLL